MNDHVKKIFSEKDNWLTEKYWLRMVKCSNFDVLMIKKRVVGRNSVIMFPMIGLLRNISTRIPLYELLKESVILFLQYLTSTTVYNARSFSPNLKEPIFNRLSMCYLCTPPIWVQQKHFHWMWKIPCYMSVHQKDTIQF